MVNFGPMMGQEPSVSPALEVPEQIARKLHLPAIIINGFMTRFGAMDLNSPTARLTIPRRPQVIAGNGKWTCRNRRPFWLVMG